MGDFNAQYQSWRSSFNNQLGRYLKDTLTYNFIILNDKRPTRITYNHSCPDLAFCLVDLLHKAGWDVDSDNFGSDHFPIYTFWKDFKKLQFSASKIFKPSS